MLGNLAGLHKALTSTPTNTFGINWNTVSEDQVVLKTKLGCTIGINLTEP